MLEDAIRKACDRITNGGWIQFKSQELLDGVGYFVQVVTLAKLNGDRVDTVCVDDHEVTGTRSQIGTGYAWWVVDLKGKV